MPLDIQASVEKTAEQAGESTWNAQEIKNLRSRLGWSQAEFARRMKTPLATISGWELGSMVIDEQHHPLMFAISGEADSCAERVQRRPLAESIMRDRGLSQIHDFDVLSSLADDIDFVK